MSRKHSRKTDDPIVIYPTIQELNSSDIHTKFYQQAIKEGANNIGAFKVRLPTGLLEFKQPLSKKRICHRFHTTQLENDTLLINRSTSYGLFGTSPDRRNSKDHDKFKDTNDAIDILEKTVRNNAALSKVRYRVDVDVLMPSRRREEGLPDETIWWPPKPPTEANLIPGISTPYMYQTNELAGSI